LLAAKERAEAKFQASLQLQAGDLDQEQKQQLQKIKATQFQLNFEVEAQVSEQPPLLPKLKTALLRRQEKTE